MDFQKSGITMKKRLLDVQIDVNKWYVGVRVLQRVYTPYISKEWSGLPLSPHQNSFTDPADRSA